MNEMTLEEKIIFSMIIVPPILGVIYLAWIKGMIGVDNAMIRSIFDVLVSWADLFYKGFFITVGIGAGLICCALFIKLLIKA